MLLSVSRRTDIPAWYSDWFLNRLSEGFVGVRQPSPFTEKAAMTLFRNGPRWSYRRSSFDCRWWSAFPS